jgi:peroxiredoxin-like protein
MRDGPRPPTESRLGLDSNDEEIDVSTYTTVATRTAVRTGEVSGTPMIPLMVFSAPPEFKGKQGVWTPEHFFTAAIGTCFITTFEAIAELSKFTFEALAVSTEGLLEKGEGGYRFTKVYVRPQLTIANEADRDRALRLLEKAERACLISRSVSSEIVLQAEVVVGIVV